MPTNDEFDETETELDEEAASSVEPGMLAAFLVRAGGKSYVVEVSPWDSGTPGDG